MISLVVRIFEFLKRHRVLRVFSLLLVTVCFAFLLLKLTYKEDISDFLPLNNKYQQAIEVYQDLSGADRIITIFQFRDSLHNDPDSMAITIAEFEDCLIHNDTAGIINDLITQIGPEKYKEFTDFVYANIPYFLSDDDYERIDTLLANDDYISAQLADDRQMLQFPVSGLLSENIQKDPLNLFTPVVARFQRFQPNVKYELYDGYIFSPDMTRAFAIMTSPFGASETEENAKLLQLLRDVADKTMSNHGMIEIRFIGGPVIAVENANQIKTDSLMSVCLAVFLIVCLLYWVFRKVRNLMLIVLSIGWGWLFAMGGLAIFHNNVSVIVIGISSVILGIAVNYPLHLIAHIRHTTDMKSALMEIVMPLVVGNVTTVGAFLALVPLKSVALRDLGAFAAFLLVGTIVFVLIWLPHMIKVVPSKNRRSFLDSLSDFSIENHRWIVAAVAILTIVLGFFSFDTSFDANMSHINFMTERQRKDMAYFQEISATSDNDQKIYVVSTDSTLEGAVTKSKKLKPIINRLGQNSLSIESHQVCQFLSDRNDQHQRLKQWNKFVQHYGQILEQKTKTHAQILGFADESFEPFYQLFHSRFEEQGLAYFNPLISTVCASQIIVDSINHNYHVIDDILVGEGNVKEVEDQLEQASPNSLVFDIKSMNSSIATNLSEDFNYIGWACALIVFLFLWFSLGSLELALLSFLPMAVSWIWILGIMAILGIKFNVVNVILATFIFGQGDDYTIFMTEGCQYEYSRGRKMLASYKNSIIISALIMFIGIGCLIIAKHPALQSLAQVTIVGMFSVVLMAYLFPPLIFKWLIFKDGVMRKRPITLCPLINSIYRTCVYYILRALTSTVEFVLHLSPASKKERIMRNFAKKTMQLIVKSYLGVNVIVDNSQNAELSSPNVLLCPNQSPKTNIILLAMPLKVLTTSSFGYFDQWLKIDMCNVTEAIHQGYCVLVDKANDAVNIASQCHVDLLTIHVDGLDNIFPSDSICTYFGKVRLIVEPCRLDYSKIQTVKYDSEIQPIACHRTTSFFKQYVLDNYRYRGIEIFSVVKKHMKRYSNYAPWIDNREKRDNVIIVNIGWGEFAMMMSLANSEINLLALDDDTDKLMVVEQCLKPNHIHVQLSTKENLDAVDYYMGSHKNACVFLLEPSRDDLKKFMKYSPIIIK